MNYNNSGQLPQNQYGMFAQAGRLPPAGNPDGRGSSPKVTGDGRFVMEAPSGGNAAAANLQQLHFSDARQLQFLQPSLRGPAPRPQAAKSANPTPPFPQMMYESQAASSSSASSVQMPALRPPARRSPSLQQTQFQKQSPSAAAASVYSPMMMGDGAWPATMPQSKDTAPKVDFWNTLGSFQQPQLETPQSSAPAAKPADLTAASAGVDVSSSGEDMTARDAWRGWPQQQLKQGSPQLYQASPPWPVPKPSPSREASPRMSGAGFPPPQKVETQTPATANAPSPSLQPSEHPDIQNVVRLLKKHGYAQMAGLIEEDADKGCLGRHDQTVAARADDRKVNGQFLSAARRLPIKENPLANYRNFVKLYSSFWQWSSHAVDSVRHTLREISFIIFIELWCRLLSLSLKKAAAFLKKFGEGHYVHHPQEISEMRRVESFAVLRDVPFVSRILRGERFHLKADNLTKKLLTTRLTMDNDTVILDILQKRLIWEPPTETASDPGLAVLASNHLKNAVTRDVGSAIITPSLPLLCGLPPPAPRDLGVKASKFGVPPNSEEPEAKTLNANLPALYRLPLVEEQEKPVIDWRAKKFEQDKLVSILSRSKSDSSILPSILALEIDAVQIEQKFAAPCNQRRRLAIGCVSISRFDNASSVAISDNSSNSIWLWNIDEAAWKATGNLYKQKVFRPWLLGYADYRSRNEMQEKNDLEPAGVSFEFDGETYTIPEQHLDETYSALATSENAGDAERFAELLGNSGLHDSSYTPACLSGHQDPVTAVSFLSPFITGSHSKLALSGSYDGRLVLWETNHKFPIFTYKSGSAILDVDSDRYGYLFLTGHTNKAACLWCMDRRNPLRVLNRHSSNVEKVRFHPNSILLATAAGDDRIRLWDQRIPDIVGLICGVRSPRCLEFAPNGRYLAISGTDSSKVQIWDLVAGKLLSSIVVDPIQNEEFATSVSFRHGSNMLAITTTKGTLQLWDLTKSSSLVNKRAGVSEPAAVDLAAYEENKGFLNSLKSSYFQGCAAEYSFNNSWAKKVRLALVHKADGLSRRFSRKKIVCCA
eukprot:Gregarina_sp_Poly_1__244@NODE_1057_length_5213_cov_40_228333_g735_i0_p1_GENE_NODE_1057_length_5213_cov_40_228333_g735_i0NODE_1057_length_5213_cov_40_228333_g735_i0_p1_ORF_typecomplete_len1052_score190_28ANAPC4_WD40/PF12894_7/2_7e03ANAPC4_WD40/PF12894_7/37ANAPC4_WD40/PF12894_7/7_1e05ANAPC4_WD40/PF12894_7/2_6e07ANAPC4_WD40/PF12894_7/0_008WD40/PF00400_32/0_0027WD40/PF00400_32/4_6e02WD40/PF00400_32/8_9e06WD40/PF00400_32/0_02WD40/PF00400_32/9_8e02TFIID_NTD2/PF04494_15/2_7e11eIF2A/PF08662_11/5_1e03eIF